MHTHAHAVTQFMQMHVSGASVSEILVIQCVVIDCQE